MGEAVSNAGRKLLAIVVLLIAAWVLFNVFVTAVTAVAWVAIVVLAIVAVVWALRVL